MRTLYFGLLLIISGYLTPSWADDVDDCIKGAGDIQVRGCSQIIKSREIFGKPISSKNLSTTYSNRGNAYSDKGQYDLAIADYNSAISLDPKNVLAYNNRGNAYRDKRQYVLAIADFNRAIELNAEYPSAYNNRGNVYDDKGQYDLAITDYSKAIELNPKSAFFYRNRANAHKNKGEISLAIDDYNIA